MEVRPSHLCDVYKSPDVSPWNSNARQTTSIWKEDLVMSANNHLDEVATGVAADSATRNLGLSDMPSVVQYLGSLVMTVMATAIAAGFDRYETIPNLSLIYVLPVVASGVAFGLGPALFSALLGALAYNFFFTEPRFSLAVADTSNIWAIALLFVIGCVTSTIASTKRHDSAELDRLHFHQAKMQVYARQMIASRSAREATDLTRSVLASLFEAPAAIILVRDDEELQIEGETKLTQLERDAAKMAAVSNEIVTAGVYPFDQSRFDFWPAPTKSDRTVVIGVGFDPQRRPANADATVEIIALMLSATLDRYEEQASHA
jgi:K+-sensing histidine kinase KdpD